MKKFESVICEMAVICYLNVLRYGKYDNDFFSIIIASSPLSFAAMLKL